MIVTILETFVDEPKGRKQRKYNYGDIVDMSASDYDRISAQQPTFLEKGQHDLGVGNCEPCTKKAELAEKRQEKATSSKETKKQS